MTSLRPRRCIRSTSNTRAKAKVNITTDIALAPRYMQLTLNTVSLAAITATLAVGLALVVGYAGRSARAGMVRAGNRIAGMGYAVPGAVIAVGVLIPVTRLDHALPGSPSRAYTSISGAARNLETRLSGAGLVGDNLGTALDAARKDALYAELLFLFLAVPGAIIAGLVTGSVASVGAGRRRSDAALLRARGASTRRLVRIALAEPFVAQERVAVPSEPYPSLIDGALTIFDRIQDTAPFVHDGAYVDGCLTRLSTEALVNVTAGGGSTVPTLLVEER